LFIKYNANFECRICIATNIYTQLYGWGYGSNVSRLVVEGFLFYYIELLEKDGKLLFLDIRKCGVSMLIYNVNVYKDNRENLVIIPYAFSSEGIRKNVNKFAVIDNINDYEKIGKMVKECLLECQREYDNHELDIMVHEIVTGKKGWANFYNVRECVYVDSDLKNFYSIKPTEKILKERSYSYIPISFDLEYMTDNVTLGKKVVETFNYCKINRIR
jgi:hypothetical protein